MGFVVPLLAAIGGGSAAAGAVATAGLGLGAYSAISGADAQRKALHGAQDQANAAGTAQTEAADAARAAQLQAYFNSDPAFSSEYNRVKAAGDTRTPTQWLSGYLQENPAEVSKFQQFTSSQAASGNGIIPSSVAGAGGTVDLGLAQQAAQGIAAQNAANSSALEAQYNPGAQELRSGSLQSLLAGLNAPQQGVEGTLPTVPVAGPAPVSAQNQALLAQVAAQAGQPLQNVGYDSPLTRAAIAKAQADLALGGQLPQDVAQLVARKAFAQAGALTGGRGLGNGRDITARDLGLTSLDLENARLQAALQGGSAEVNLNQGISNQQLAAQQYARNNLLQSQGATQADQAQQNALYVQQQQLAQQAAAQEASNYFNQNSLLQSIQNGTFGRNLAAAQLGQSITPPASGLDPGAVVNLAVGNSNVAANAQQNANAAAAQAANNKSQLGGQLLGTALGFAQNYFKPTAAPALPTATSYFGPSVFGSYA